MEALETQLLEEPETELAWPDRPPVKMEEQEMDRKAFHLWQEASRQGAAAAEETD